MTILSGRYLQHRIDRKWSFRYAARALEMVYKPTGGDRDAHIAALIGELKRRGKIVPSISVGIAKAERIKQKRIDILEGK